MARRRLLVGAGFTAANLVALRALPSPGTGSGPLGGARPDLPEPPATGPVHDIVIAGGRVMDPGSGFDAEADVGIDGATVAAVSQAPLRGTRRIDARGRVVAPGFIDILSYDPNPYGIWFKVADGVTTNLCMHGVRGESASWLRRWEDDGSPAHFGGAFKDPWAREELGIDPARAAGPGQVRAVVERAEKGVADGWIGLDVEPEYTPGITAEEIDGLGRVAAAAGVPLFFHGRYSDEQAPGTNADTLDEVLGTARRTGAAVHVEHICSTGGTFSMERSLATLDAARGEGVDVTACTYPYDSWAAYLGTPRFNAGWQERFRIDYGDLVIAGTGERLDAASFERYQRENRLAAALAIPEPDVRAALSSPWVMLGSDGILEPEGNNHPRGAGTFARTLGRYSRELGVISLMEALAKMTWVPAQRLEARAPALRRKGRLQSGSDADVTVFDPATVADRATLRTPERASQGVDWVLVAGRVVKSPDGLDRQQRPGQPIRYG